MIDIEERANKYAREITISPIVYNSAIERLLKIASEQKCIDKEIAFNIWKTKFHVGEFYEGMRADFDALWDRIEKSMEE